MQTDQNFDQFGSQVTILHKFEGGFNYFTHSKFIAIKTKLLELFYGILIKVNVKSIITLNLLNISFKSKKWHFYIKKL